MEWSLPELELKLHIQAVLGNMSIPHRTMLKDSKVYGTMELWAKASPWDSGRSSGTSSPGPPSRYSTVVFRIRTVGTVVFPLYRTVPNSLRQKSVEKSMYGTYLLCPASYLHSINECYKIN